MKSAHFDVEPDGFYGAYWKSEQPSDCALIAMLGDDPEDYLARSAVKWMSRQGINVMTMSPAKRTTAITIIRLNGLKRPFAGSKRTAIEKSALWALRQRVRLR